MSFSKRITSLERGRAEVMKNPNIFETESPQYHFKTQQWLDSQEKWITEVFVPIVSLEST